MIRLDIIVQFIEAVLIYDHFPGKYCEFLLMKRLITGGLSPIAFSHSTDQHPSDLTAAAALAPPLSVPLLPENMRALGGEHVIVCESSLLLEEMLLDDTPPPQSTRYSSHSLFQKLYLLSNIF